MNHRELFNRVIRQDLSEYLGFDLFLTCEVLKKGSESLPFAMFVHHLNLDAIKAIAKNIEKVLERYFLWDQDRFADPLDQYYGTCGDGFDEMMGELLDGFDVDFLECPIRYEIAANLSDLFEDFPEVFLDLGLRHKFQIEAIIEMMEQDDESH